MPRSLIVTAIISVFFLVGCGAKSSMPSDNSMLENFFIYERHFEKLKEISVKYNDFHYPPYNEKDSITNIISPDDRKELDSLLKEVKIVRILSVDSSEVHFLLYTSGLSISGGYKGYIYSSKLSDEIERYNEECILNPGIKKFLVKIITSEELEQVAQQYSTNLELYRPIKDSWYIHLSREN